MAHSMISTSDGEKLYVKHIKGRSPESSPQSPILYIHGAIENGRIFYSDSGKGIAPYLANHGYEGYVIDLRGRGRSLPPISSRSRHGQTEVITDDIPTVIKRVKPKMIIAHSWGGVLLLSTLARFPELQDGIAKIVFFGVKKTVRVQNLEKVLKIDLIWNLLSPLLCKIYGYLPAKEWKLGADQETSASLNHSRAWVKSSKWVDPVDGFNYEEAVKKIDLPPILSIMGTKDFSLGHVDDATRFLIQAGAKNVTISKVPFGHVDMLVGSEAQEKVFPSVLSWIEQKS